MANIKSQKKRILTNEKRRVRNQSVKSELKTLVRKTREAVEAGDKEVCWDEPRHFALAAVLAAGQPRRAGELADESAAGT